MSERYPLISEIVDEKRIPQFDNLYLDMNGIIHHCSHPNDNDPTYRITETQIFLSIFGYIGTQLLITEYIFSIIKPTKVFMLAVDGVAPRAKMNRSLD
jgi:5'-3' exoribonuclease 1